jgi:hypothetical protein
MSDAVVGGDVAANDLFNISGGSWIQVLEDEESAASGIGSARLINLAAANDPLKPLPGLYAYDQSTISLIGFDFTSILLHANYQDGTFSLYQFTGRLADGTEIMGSNILVQNGSGASFQFLAPVPEPSSLAPVAAAVPLGLASLIRRRRRAA